MSNHGDYPLPDISAFYEKLGATQKYPEGRLVPHDEGEIVFAIGVKDGKVVMDFGKSTAWIGMLPEQAIELGNLLIEKANQLSR